MTFSSIQRELGDTKQLEACARQFGVVGDRTRLKICYLLCHYPEMNVSKIAGLISESPSTVSHSLRKLRDTGLVEHRRAHKLVFYSLKRTPITKTIQQLLA